LLAKLLRNKIRKKENACFASKPQVITKVIVVAAAAAVKQLQLQLALANEVSDYFVTKQLLQLFASLAKQLFWLQRNPSEAMTSF
jgi:hypothetical protein